MDLFSELADPWTTIVSSVVLLAAVVYAWKNALAPAWNWVTDRVHKRDKQQILEAFASGFTTPEEVADANRHWAILVDVAKFLEPNGMTLAEHLQELNANDDRIEAKLDGFIVERLEGGRRHYDITPGDN